MTGPVWQTVVVEKQTVNDSGTLETGFLENIKSFKRPLCSRDAWNVSEMLSVI